MPGGLLLGNERPALAFERPHCSAGKFARLDCAPKNSDLHSARVPAAQRKKNRSADARGGDMQVKQFLIELQYGESTRFLFDDRNLADHICAIASDAGRWQTEGPRPMATVYQIE